MEMMTPDEMAKDMARMAALKPEERRTEMKRMEQQMAMMREMRMADDEIDAKKMYPNSMMKD